MIKNINIKLFNKLKEVKLKLKKAKALLLVAPLAFSLMISGCGVSNVNEQEPPRTVITSSSSTDKEDIKNTVNNVVNEVEKEAVNAFNNVDKAEMAELQASLSGNVTLSSAEVAALNQVIDGYQVKYAYSEYYGVKEALNKYNSMSEYNTVSSNYIQNGKINVSALKEQVKRNNSAYLENYKGSKYKGLSSSDFDKVFNHVVDGLNYVIQNGVDIPQLDDNLGNLKILDLSGFLNGEVSDKDMVMGINMKFVSDRQSQYPNVDLLRTVTLHETNHLGQVCSVKEKENEGYDANFGMAYRWDDLSSNPLNFMWFYEGSAENLVGAEYGSTSARTFYENNVKNLESLTLATLLRSDADELTLSKLSLQPDLNKLFDLFGCKTQADKEEVVHMMHAIEISLNQKSDFMKTIKAKTGKELSAKEQIAFENSLKASVAQTLTKTFYRNLVDKTQGGLKLQEVFSHISVFETEMNRLVRYTDTSGLESNAEFIKMYQEIQNEFFTYVGKSLNISGSDVQALYQTYYEDKDMSGMVYSETLSNSEKNYMNTLIESRSANHRKTINELNISQYVK